MVTVEGVAPGTQDAQGHLDIVTRCRAPWGWGSLSLCQHRGTWMRRDANPEAPVFTSWRPISEGAGRDGLDVFAMSLLCLCGDVGPADWQ